jgi:hypothetical protein
MAQPKTHAARAPGEVPFEGFPMAFYLTGLGLLAAPIVVFALGAASDPVAGAWFGATVLVISLAYAAWPVLTAAVGLPVRVAVVALALAAAAAGGYPLWMSLLPGDPTATAVLSRADEERPLSGLAAGPYDFVVHADLGNVAGRDVTADYVLKLYTDGTSRDLHGRFESRRGRGRAGRRTVTVVRAPREWSHPVVELAAGKHKIQLLKKDAIIAGPLEVKAYAQVTLWVFGAAIGGVVLAAVALAARAPTRPRRHHLIGGMATSGLTGVVGAWFTWVGDPVYPLIGAAFLGLLGGWLCGRLLAPVAAALPWAR